SHATTRHKGKKIAKPITPLSESASEEDIDPKQAQKDKEMHKNLALITKYFKKIYKPTNNNLRTSSNTKNKNVDTTPKYKNNNQTGQFRNQRIIIVAGARETVGGQVVQQSRIQCFNCKEFGHFAKECRKPKRVKDSKYHKEKMLVCKQAEKGVPLQAKQSDWLADTDEEIDEQELEAHYTYMAKIQEVPTADSGTDSEPLEKEQYDAAYNVFANERQHSEQPESNDQNAIECDDERIALANLIANLKLDVDENKKIQKKLKKANTTLAHELTECKSILAETTRTLRESNSIRDSCLLALQNKQTEFERYKNLNDRTVDYEKLEHKLNETLGLLAQRDIDIKEGLKLKAYEISIVQEKHDELVPDREETLTLERESRSKLNKDLVKPYDYTKLNRKSVETKFDKPSVVQQPNAQRIPKLSVLGKPAPFSDSLERKSFSKTKSVPKTNVSEGLSKPVTTQILPQTARQDVRNTNVIKPGMYQIDTRTTQTRAPQFPQTSRNTNPRVSTSTGVIHNTNVNRPHLRSKKKFIQDKGCSKFKRTAKFAPYEFMRSNAGC
ncbi:retrovirus-related pol polyprotein from transposon TNT 1-94, partial [Tanacetum coccineum]